MNKVIFLILIIISSSFSQSKFGIIDDPDEYTNLRMKPDINSTILRKILKGEIFEYYKIENNNWYYVQTQNGINGYVHKSRIISVEDSIYNICTYSYPNYPKDIVRPNFIFNYPNGIISLCGKVNNNYPNHDEVSLDGAVIKNCRTNQSIYLNECDIKNINNKVKIIEKGRLPAGLNWEWENDVVIGEIVITNGNFKRITELKTKVTKKNLNEYYTNYKAGNILEDP